MADYAQLVAQYDGSDRAQLGRQYSKALTLITAIDGGNVSATSTIDDANSDTPTVNITFRSATYQAPIADGWRHALFAVDDAEGKTPTFKLDRNTMQEKTETPNANYLPMWTADFITWTQASSRTLTGGSTGTIDFSFDAPLPAGQVYIATHPIGRYQDSVDFAAELLADYSSVASPTTSADSYGIFHVSPTENDENSRAVGGKSMFSIKLEFGGATTDGESKRTAVLFAGIHAAGENVSWRSFEGFVRWALDDASTEADNFRANWNVYLYFLLTPNGVYDGQKRRNPRSTDDTNREFNYGGTSDIDEIEAVSSAVLADLSSVDFFMSFHTHFSATSPLIINSVSSDTNVTAFIGYAEPIFDATADRDNYDATVGMDFKYMTQAFSPTVSVDAEFPMLQNTAQAYFSNLGAKWAQSVVAADQDGLFAPSTFNPAWARGSNQVLGGFNP